MVRHNEDDAIRPNYYRGISGMDVIDVIEDFGLGFLEGNILKYIVRANYKGQRLQDLRKAREYLDRLIDESSEETVEVEVKNEFARDSFFANLPEEEEDGEDYDWNLNLDKLRDALETPTFGKMDSFGEELAAQARADVED